MTSLELDNFSKGRDEYISVQSNVRVTGSSEETNSKSVKWMELGIVRIWFHMMLLLSSYKLDKLCKCLPFSHNQEKLLYFL